MSEEKFGMAILMLEDNLIELRKQEEKYDDRIKSTTGNEKLKATLEAGHANCKGWIKEIEEAIAVLSHPQPSVVGDDVVFTLDQLRNAYYAGFNQAHYGHMHPDVCPPKECESAGIEYANNNLKNGVPISSLIPARVSEEAIVDVVDKIYHTAITDNFVEPKPNELMEGMIKQLMFQSYKASLIPKHTDSKEQEK